MNNFADILEKHINKTGYSLGQLARLSQLPKRTIANWVEGRVKRPRHQLDIIKVANALHLTEADTNLLLTAAGFQVSLAELRQLANQKEDEAWLNLLSAWPEIVYQETPPPFQAIRDLPYFVGREKEIEAIKTALLTKKLCCLHGMGGVGKTTLATHLAYLLRPFFVDGVLWARTDTSDPMAILATFANAYGHDVTQYNDLHSRSRVVRQIMANKEALVVLDNVQTDAQLELLLPPSGRCAVMVTTRHTNLSILLGVHWFHIQPFEAQFGESLALFARILGEERVAQEAAAFGNIANLLGHLPLAIALVAGRLAHTSSLAASDFYELLQTSEKRLDALVYGQASLTASFNTTYQFLSELERQLFSWLGVFGGEDFETAVVAAVSSQPVSLIKTTLSTFLGLSLLQEGRPGRFRLHPLVQDFAQARATNPNQIEQMITYFCQAVVTHQHDFSWLDTEFSNISYALEAAWNRQIEEPYVTAVNALYQYLDTRGLYDFLEKHLTQALKISEKDNHLQCQAETQLLLSVHQLRCSAYAQALENLTQGLYLARQIEDARLISGYLSNRGRAYRGLGQLTQALTDMKSAITIERSSDDNRSLARTLAATADILMALGEMDQAQVHLEESLAFARTFDEQVNLTDTLTFLGILAVRQGQTEAGRRYLEEDLQRAREAEHHVYAARALLNLAILDYGSGHYAQAQVRLEESLALARKIDHELMIMGNLLYMGQLTHKQGDSETAVAQLQEALDLAHQLKSDYFCAQIHQAFSSVYAQTGQIETAIDQIEQALTLARRMGIGEISAPILADYGLIASQQTDGEQADTYLAESETIARQEGDLRILAHVLACSGQRYVEQGNLKEATAVWQEGVALAEQCDLQETKATILWAKARALHLEDPVQAQQFAQQSLSLFQRFGDYRAAVVSAWLNGMSS